MEYLPYKEYELHDMFKEPRRISKNPYKLFAAYMLSCLFELYDPENEIEGIPFIPEETWGWVVDKDLLDKTAKNAIEQFIDACDNDLNIDIWNRGYSIRRANHIDRSRLTDIFKFPIVASDNGDCYRIIKNGIMNLECPYDTENDNPIAEFTRNKLYLQKVIETAKDDEHDGYDKLTDMEVTMYCWHAFCNKIKSRDYWIFRKTYDRYLYTTEDDDRECFNDKAQKTGRHDTQYLFSANKVKKWNEEHHQKSIINI